MTARTYARVYHEIVDDPKFRRVYHDDAALSTWLRMLLIADAMYPASAQMPEMTPAVALLLKVGLVKRRPGNRYIVTGLEREREMRSQSARNAAAVRWQSKGNADAMPNKAEQSRTEQSNGANAPGAPTVYMGYPPKPKPGLHDGQHGKDCGVCFPKVTV